MQAVVRTLGWRRLNSQLYVRSRNCLPLSRQRLHLPLHRRWPGAEEVLPVSSSAGVVRSQQGKLPETSKLAPHWRSRLQKTAAMMWHQQRRRRPGNKRL